jgi:hypothetical protein
MRPGGDEWAAGPDARQRRNKATKLPGHEHVHFEEPRPGNFAALLRPKSQEIAHRGPVPLGSRNAQFPVFLADR